MPKEPFLVNPVRIKRPSKFANPLPGPLLSRMVRKYGPKQGMKKAWGAYRAGARKNPLGEELMVVGANPPLKYWGKKKEVIQLARRRRRYRVNSWADDRARHRAAALKGWRKRRRSRTTALVRRRRVAHPRRVRRYRRNPVAVAAFGGISPARPMSLIVPIGVGVAARFATVKAPQLLSISSPLPRYGVQAAVAIGGGLVLGRFLGRTNAAVWTIVSGVTIVESLLNEYIFQRAIATAGLSAYAPELGAFPDGAEVGAYPFGGPEPAY